MKKLKIERLTLRNFKGIKDFALQTDGADIKVFGDNATGKTTLFDAFTWLLFDKDSSNKKDFAVKTIDDKGNERHGLEHEVEAVLFIDDAHTTLKKVYKEQWTKKRGSATKEFTGHTTKYFIDDVPSKKKEFEQAVKDIVDENIFKLLTSPSYFNEQMHWKDRRNTLLEIAGDVTEEEVINSSSKLAKLKDILNGKSIDDQRKIIVSKRKEINEELDRIPVRIDEVNRSKPDLIGVDKNKLQQDIESIETSIEAKQEEINRLKSGSEITEQKRLLSEIEMEINEIKAEYQRHNQEVMSDLSDQAHKKKLEANEIQSSINANESAIHHGNESIERLEKQADDLRKEWQEANERAFQWDEHDHDSDNVCPTCAQELPSDQIEEAKRKAEKAKQEAFEHFNKQKSTQLESIKESGVKKGNEIEIMKGDIENSRLEIDHQNSLYKRKLEEIQSLEKQQEEAQSKTMDISDSHDYQEKVAERKRIEEKIAELNQSSQQNIDRVNSEIQELQEEFRSAQADLTKFDQAKTADERIKQLSDEERSLAEEYEQLEEQLYLTEEFIRMKVNMLEERINSKFGVARFKLFEQQINEGVKETCETIVNGVPYSKGLNNAARINVGLDIIRTLSQHYGFSASIFVDNSEAVTKLLEIDAQIISLVVSEKDKRLRVEGSEKSEVA